MDQLTFQFPFKTTYYKEDFYVSSNNFEAYKLIESWPKWPDKNINIFGPKGCGKTHLANILRKKIDSIILEPKDITNNSLEKIKIKECIIVDHYEDNVSENLLYSILNQAKQDGQYVLINSVNSVKKTTTKLKDLKSRLNSFITLGINLPTDNLLRVIITKSFSDKQIKVNVQILEYILKNIDRSYEKMFKFIKNVDKESLSSGKSININLIKKILKKNEHI